MRIQKDFILNHLIYTLYIKVCDVLSVEDGTQEGVDGNVCRHGSNDINAVE